MVKRATVPNHGEPGPRLPGFSAVGNKDEKRPDPLDASKNKDKLRQPSDPRPLHQKNAREQYGQDGEEDQTGAKEVCSEKERTEDHW